MSKVMDNAETIRFFRSILNRKQFYVITERGSDRRKSFFSFIEDDRRDGHDRRVNVLR